MFLKHKFLFYLFLLAINMIEFFSGLIALVFFFTPPHCRHPKINNLTPELSAITEDACSGNLFNSPFLTKGAVFLTFYEIIVLNLVVNCY